MKAQILLAICKPIYTEKNNKKKKKEKVTENSSLLVAVLCIAFLGRGAEMSNFKSFL